MTTATLRATCDDHTRYVAGCRPCQQRTANRGRTRRRAAAYGHIITGHADTTPAREHIAALHDQHRMSYRHIAYAAGVRRDAVRLIANGSQPLAYPETVRRILAVSPAPSIDEIAVRRVLAGHAPITRLSDAERAELWRLWRRQHTSPVGEATFARQFGVTKSDAGRIRYAADRAATNPSHAATGRTNRKAA
ncbi:hypothetical protein [Verrucosispora sp. NA02020]|uniref:hypothetical protein n=1 Tax=Verrucosispora sp. NA02020 TaxID=2742132 RepID=UPI0015920519|nr:hypothetical protein [Verrucosispora sp. NA02020]QKW15342.1 hypothetical protein HUT12_22985 [Verrucosispora sp. NA02020]